MNRRPAISLEGITKDFRLGEYHAGLLRGIGRRLLGGRGKSTTEAQFHRALDAIDLEVKEGEVLGIIGQNESGKSTLLKILARTTAPTAGEGTVRGRVAPLLEVGTGFNPDLTGRENIYVNGSLLGMRRREIKAEFADIVEFAGVEKFIDTPLKRCSSGIMVRLGFAIAAHLRPEILLVDEVLAVGDAEFQHKCLSRIGQAASGGRTVLFVSHQLDQIERVCDSVILLHRGRIVAAGEAPTVIREYLSSFLPDTGRQAWPEPQDRIGSGVFRITDMRVVSDAGEAVASVGQPMAIQINYECNGSTAARPVFWLFIKDQKQRLVTASSSAALLGQGWWPDEHGGRMTLQVPSCNLTPGRYTIYKATISIRNEVADRIWDGYVFDVAAGSAFPPNSPAPESIVFAMGGQWLDVRTTGVSAQLRHADGS